MGQEEFRSGFVTVLGRPNVGKSTLVNKLVGQKISIVTAKPQTTRHAILGILSEPSYQAIFIDTPGIHSKAGKLINRMMNRAATGSLEGADLVLMLIEAGQWHSGDERVLEHVKSADIPCILVINKVDLIADKSNLLPFIEQSAKHGNFAEIVPLSALKDKGLDRLKQQIARYLPEGAHLFPADTTTDRSMEFRIAEVIREKLMRSLHDEIPYGLCVEIQAVEERGELVLVDAIIWVDKESHKAIVVGRGGQSLKKIGRAARLELQELFGKKFHIETRAKLKRNWYDNAVALRQLGYDIST